MPRGGVCPELKYCVYALEERLQQGLWRALPQLVLDSIRTGCTPFGQLPKKKTKQAEIQVGHIYFCLQLGQLPAYRPGRRCRLSEHQSLCVRLA